MQNSVLVVDDSLVARKLLIRALPKDWASDIGHASNGAQALDALREKQPHVMFLDLNMPEMDGYEVLSTMKREQITANVIVLSADIQPQAYERVMALGAKAFVKKPIVDRDLAETLQRCGIL